MTYSYRDIATISRGGGVQRWNTPPDVFNIGCFFAKSFSNPSVLPNAVRVSAGSPEPNHPSSAVVNDLLDFSSTASSNTQVNGNNSLVGDFGSLSLAPQQEAPSNQNAEVDDMFGSFAAAPAIDPVIPTAPPQQASPVDKAAQPATSSQGSADLMSLSGGGAAGGDKKSTADILSLFGDQSKGPTHPIVPVGGFAAFGLQAAPQQSIPAVPNMAAAPKVAENKGYPVAPAMMGMGFVSPMVQMPNPMPQMPNPMPQMPNAMPQMPYGMSQQGFPNPFEQPSGGAALQGMQFAPTVAASSLSAHPQSPTACSTRANNAFADLSIGKVLNMNYLSKPVVPATTAQPQATTTPANMNFDDLLGL
ncbi:hypothetical protein COOONC_04544 [Cooperia oncophora]